MIANDTITEAGALVDLSDIGVLMVSGADRVQFLQGQLSADVATLDSKASSLAAYCSPQGRILALVRILHVGSALWLLMPAERIEAVAHRLKMFVLAADVDIALPNDPPLRVLGLFGTAHEQCELLGLPADQPNATRSADRITTVRIGLENRYFLIGTAPDLQSVQTHTAVPIGGVDNSSWRRADIRAGLPTVYDATADSFIPQMINLDKLGAIDFNKGCYVGQEVVARTQYLGKLKRRLYQVAGDIVTPPVPGSRLHSGGGNGSSVGQIVDACADPDKGFIGLAVIVAGSAGEPVFLPQCEQPLLVCPVEQ